MICCLSRRLLAATFAMAVAYTPVGMAADELVGAGSSAAAPVYRVWTSEYAKRGGEPISYDPVGSGAGMKRIRAREADFGASDVVATGEELARDDLVMFPTVITGVVPVINLPKIGARLRLTGEVLARIYLGEISQWNAPEIAALNPGESLPDLPIRVVCRGDSSGTSYHFTDYLSKVSPTWKTRFGATKKPAWPASFLAEKGSSGVSKTVRATVGAIGYIDYNYVIDDGLSGVSMRNASGKFLAPSTEGFFSAAKESAWYSEGDFAQTLSDMPGEASWPITMGTYVAVPRVATDAKRTARALRFFTWAFGYGNVLAKQAKFVPLPEKVQAKAFRQIARVTGKDGELIGIESIGALANVALAGR